MPAEPARFPAHLGPTRAPQPVAEAMSAAVSGYDGTVLATVSRRIEELDRGRTAVTLTVGATSAGQP